LHTSSVHSLSFSPDGRTLASASADETLRLWDVSDARNASALGQPLTGHTAIVWSTAFSPAGRILASASGDGTVRVWNMDVDQDVEQVCAAARSDLTVEKWRTYIPDMPYAPYCV
jgi:WD40 repeat protein